MASKTAKTPKPAAKAAKPAAKAAAKAPKKAAKPKTAPAGKPSPAVIAQAQHDHQDPRVGAQHGHAQPGHDKQQHTGIPPAPRFNRVINWFRRGRGR